MAVIEWVRPSRVVWRCTQGPSEWVGTTVSFDLRSEGDETALRFAHAGWREPVEFMSHCSTAWGAYLLGLKRGLEGGTATPWPHAELVSSWG